MKKESTKKFKYRKNFSELRNGLLFSSVWLVGFCVLTLYPLIQTLIFSFNNVQVRPTGEIILTAAGVSNYMFALVTDADFLAVIGEYVGKMILYVPVITVVSLILAMLLNSRLRLTGLFRTIFFLPVIIASGPVIAMFVEQGVAQFPGIENLINFEALAGSVPQFILSPLNSLVDEFIMILWYCGIQILVFITGLQKIDSSVFEAASIDGANKWEMFWKVTLPAISPTIVVNIVFTVIMQSSFSLNPVIIKIKEDLNGSGEGAGYGYSSAMAWLYFIVLCLVLGAFVLLFNLLFKKRQRRKGV